MRHDPSIPREIFVLCRFPRACLANHDNDLMFSKLIETNISDGITDASENPHHLIKVLHLCVTWELLPCLKDFLVLWAVGVHGFRKGIQGPILSTIGASDAEPLIKTF